MTTTYRLVAIHQGPHVLTQVHAGTDPDHLHGAGELLLPRDAYDDLVARLGHAGTALIDTARAWRLGERSGTDLIEAVIAYELVLGRRT